MDHDVQKWDVVDSRGLTGRERKPWFQDVNEQGHGATRFIDDVGASGGVKRLGMS